MNESSATIFAGLYGFKDFQRGMACPFIDHNGFLL
jgi:hypothetical protein